MNRLFKFLFVCLFIVAASGAMAETSAAPKWTTSVNLGLNMTRGNSKTTAGNGSIVSERKGDKNEVSLGIEGNYGESEESQSDGSKEMKTTVQNEKGYAQYRRLFTERDYAYFKGELSQDRIADIKYRLIIGPGMGRYFIKSNSHTLGGETGPSWIRDKVGDDEGDRFALRVAQNYEWKISDRAKIWQNLEYVPALDDFNNYLVNGEIGTEAAMNSKVSLRLVAKDQYNNKPADGKKKNDFFLTAGVGCKF